jgi:hypothetical protein
MSWEAWGDGDDSWDWTALASDAGWLSPDDYTPGTMDVLNERVRQQQRVGDGEGYTSTHDDSHADGSIAIAAACYALEDGLKWPWRDGWKPKDRRANMVRAAALLLAEIDRLDRASALEVKE